MKNIHTQSLLSLAVLLLAGCTAVSAGSPAERGPDSAASPAAPENPGKEQVVVVELQDYGPAPELTNEVWLNVDRPLRLADLRGKVVLIEMWTFG